MEETKKTIGLVRVSTVIQSEGSGLQFQTEKILQYGLLRDIKVDKIITDVCSGSLESRDGIEALKMMRLIRLLYGIVVGFFVLCYCLVSSMII